MRVTKNTASTPPKKQKRPWWALAVLLLLVGGASSWYFLIGPGKGTQAASAQSTPSYQTAAAKLGDLRVSVAGTGNLVASQTADLSFSASGTVTELDVQLGDKVTAGQVLARLGSSQTLQASLASAQLAYLQAQKDLNDLQKNAAVSLAAAYQAWVQAQIDYNDAVFNNQRTAYARCSQETNTKYADQIKLLTERLPKLVEGTDRYINTKADLATAQANYAYCIGYTAAEKSEAQANEDVAKGALVQAEATYNTLKAASGLDPEELSLLEARVQQARTQLDSAQKALDGITITAPMDGVVTYLAGSLGSSVDTAKFITISDVSSPTVEIQVDEADLKYYTVGSQVEITFDALPDEIFTGKVVEVDPALTNSFDVTAAKGKVLLDADAADRLEGLPLGMTATAEIIYKEAKSAVLIPVEALRDLGDGQYAVFVVANGKLQFRTVQVGLQDDTRAEITSGLSAGDVVSTGLVPTSK